MERNTELTIRVNGKLMDFSTPKVMGILNVTPDSFYAGSRTESAADIARRVEQIITEGADIIDVGGCSTRPGAESVSREEEMARLRRGLEIIRKVAPDAVVSVDTFRADAAAMCVEEYGAALVNDVSGGQADARMFDTAARLNVPYVLTHMQDARRHIHDGAPAKNAPGDGGEGTTGDCRTGTGMVQVMQYFALRVQDLHGRGVKDIIIDPGFGFGKTLNGNYVLLKHLEDFKLFGLPVLAGISRKSMIYKLLGGTPEEASDGTNVLNAIALTKGADILRVHDVKACVEAVRIFNKMNEQE